jgi:protein-tyrosine phosphatase
VSTLIDTHSHMLPGVDHGCPNLATSIRMAREAAASGIRAVFCTPHMQELMPGDIEHTREVGAQVRVALAQEGIGLDLLLGFEVDLSIAATQPIEELRALTIESSKAAIVLEMPYEGWPRFLEQTLFRLATWGFQPVLAHPERNARIQKSPELLVGCLKAGAVAQATAASLTGEFGRGAERAFAKLLSQGAIGLLGSDAHAYRKDSWTLAPVLESLRGVISEEDMFVLVQENPRRLLAGQPLLKVRPQAGSGTWSRGRRQKSR